MHDEVMVLEYICPVCNGLQTICETCPQCGANMDDTGMPENYYGPYSPYENADLYEPPYLREAAEAVPCIHLYSCPSCGYDKRISFSQVLI